MDTLEIRGLARRLIEHGDDVKGIPPEDRQHHLLPPQKVAPFIAPKAFEILRVSLSKTIGVVGFQALLSRALSLAKQQVPWLKAVQVNDSGELEGLMEATALLGNEDSLTGYTTLMEQVLKLLITFVGGDLTLLLVRDAWPDGPLIPTETPLINNRTPGEEDTSV